jgi:hypothetical protein
MSDVSVPRDFKSGDCVSSGSKEGVGIILEIHSDGIEDSFKSAIVFWPDGSIEKWNCCALFKTF